jgi:hypothetical protein
LGGTNEKNFIAKRNKEHNPKAGGQKTAHTTKGKIKNKTIPVLVLKIRSGLDPVLTYQDLT